MSERLTALQRWVEGASGTRVAQLLPASNDASFRRYYRVHRDGGTLIAVDAPPGTEAGAQFVRVAELFGGLGLHVPTVYAADLEQGFLLLSDLGERLYLPALTPETVQRLYGDALGALLVLQACGPHDGAVIPPYEAARLETELGLFRDWFLGRHLGLTLGEGALATLEEAFAFLVATAREQPQVCVHRDYHSRNLLVTPRNNPGIVDFQDALVGPVTYDLVSLLRDCYISWPRDQVEDWALGYHELACQAGVLRGADEAQFLRWFDLMGVQRHLKAIGIFARLWHRDGKPGYLADIPRTLAYVREVSGRHPELHALAALLDALPPVDITRP